MQQGQLTTINHDSRAHPKWSNLAPWLPHLGAGLVDLVVTRVVLRFGHDLVKKPWIDVPGRRWKTWLQSHWFHGNPFCRECGMGKSSRGGENDMEYVENQGRSFMVSDVSRLFYWKTSASEGMIWSKQKCPTEAPVEYILGYLGCSSRSCGSAFRNWDASHLFYPPAI